MHDSRSELEISPDFSRFEAGMERNLRMVEIAVRRFGRTAEQALLVAQSFERVLAPYQDAIADGLAVIAVAERIPLRLLGLAGPDLPPSRDEVMQGALEARQNRNTGPQRRVRAPKRLDQRGTRQ